MTVSDKNATQAKPARYTELDDFERALEEDFRKSMPMPPEPHQQRWEEPMVIAPAMSLRQKVMAWFGRPFRQPLAEPVQPTVQGDTRVPGMNEYPRIIVPDYDDDIDEELAALLRNKPRHKLSGSDDDIAPDIESELEILLYGDSELELSVTPEVDFRGWEAPPYRLQVSRPGTWALPALFELDEDALLAELEV